MSSWKKRDSNASVTGGLDITDKILYCVAGFCATIGSGQWLMANG